MRAYFRGFGSSRVWGLLGASALASLVAGCGWFDSTPTVKVTPVRPGAERSVPAGGLQASGNGRQYDGDIRPVDNSRPIGSLIPDKGGQKAQLDTAAKEAAERDSAAREEEAKRKAEEAPAPLTPASVPSADAVPPPPNLTGTSAVPPPPNLPGTSAPLPPPGPVTSAPMPPPSSSAPESAAPAALPTPGSPPAAQP
jgi:hypothetical protein